MNNKKGGFGAKLALVLILMIASAVGGAYAYRVVDGKMAANDALKAVENVDISDYDTAEQSTIQGYIDDAKKDIETAKTRKEVYEIITEFIANVDKVQTKSQKELEAALKAAEEAKSKYESQNSSNSYGSGTDEDSDSGDSSYKSNQLNSNSNSNSNNNNNSNTTDDDEDDDSNGFLGSLLGGLSSGSSGN